MSLLLHIFSTNASNNWLNFHSIRRGCWCVHVLTQYCRVNNCLNKTENSQETGECWFKLPAPSLNALFKTEVQSWLFITSCSFQGRSPKFMKSHFRCRNKVQAQSWLSMKPQPRCRNKVWCSVFQIFASSVLQSVSMSLTNQLILSVLQTIILKTGIKLQRNCKFYGDITGVHFSRDNIARLITSAMV